MLKIHFACFVEPELRAHTGCYHIGHHVDDQNWLNCEQDQNVPSVLGLLNFFCPPENIFEKFRHVCLLSIVIK